MQRFYNITVSLNPKAENPKCVTIPIVRRGDEPTADACDLISGFPGSPVEHLIRKYGIVTDTFFILEITEILSQPVESFLPPMFKIKRFDEIYGYWITGNGELIPVTQVCGHFDVSRYGYQDGWIAVVTHNEGDLSFRFFGASVTKLALLTLLDIIRKSNYPVYNCEFGLEIETTSKTMVSKMEANKHIRGMIAVAA